MNGDKLKTIVLFLALLGNAAAWLWGAGGRYEQFEMRISQTERRLDKVELLLDRLAEQSYNLSMNLEVLTAIIKEREKRNEVR